MPQPDVALPGAPGGRPPSAPPGVPDVIFQGGELPLTGTAPGPAPGPVSPEAARLTLLEQLSSSPEVSEETREWARLVLEAIVGP